MKRRQAGSRVPRTLMAAAVASLLGSPVFARPRPHAEEAPAAAPARAEKVATGPDAAAKYKAKAEDLKNQGKYEEALQQYQNALTALPDDVQTLQDFGRTLYARGKFQDAAEKFKRIVQVAPDQPVAFYNLGYALRKIGDYAGAADAYSKYVQMVPDDADGYYGLAECLRAQKKGAEAAAQYDQYVAHETRASEQAWVEKAKAKAANLRAGGDGAVAMNRTANVTTISSADQTPHTQAETVTSQPTTDERVATAPAAAPATATTAVTTTVASAAAAVAPAASPAAAPVSTPAPTTTTVASAPVAAPVTVAVATPPPAPVAAPVAAPAPVTQVAAPAPNPQGGLLANAGMTMRADGTVVSAPKPAPMMLSTRDPAAAISKIKEGDGLFTQKRYREALFAYQDAVKLDDESVNALLKMGLAYANLNYFKEAIDKWNRVLELDPNNAYAKTYIAKATQKMQQMQGAAPTDQPQPVGAGTGVTTATAAPAAAPAPAAPPAASPEDEAAAKDAYRRAVGYMGQSNFPAAITELTAAIQKYPGFVNAWVARGGAYLGAKSYNESAADYQRALQLDQTLATPLYGLGRAYDKLGDRAKACDYYRRYTTSNGRDAQPRLKEQAAQAAAQLCQ